MFSKKTTVDSTTKDETANNLLPQDAIIGICFAQTKQMRSVIDGMAHLKSDGVFVFTPVEFIIQCETRTSHSKTVIDCLHLDIAEYKYEVDEKHVMFGGSLQTMSQCLTIATHTDHLLIYVNKKLKDRNSFMIQMCAADRQHTHSFVMKMSLTDLPVYQPKRLKNFKVCICMNSQEFLRILRVCKKNGSTVQFITKCENDRNFLYFITKGENLGSDMWSKTMFQWNAQDVNPKTVECMNENTYSLNLLLSVAKASTLCSNVYLHVNDSRDVLGVRYNVSTIGTFTCFFAPMKEKSTFDVNSKLQLSD